MGTWQAGARCLRVIGVGACGLELVAFCAVTLHQTFWWELIGPDKQSQANTDERRLNGEMHVKAFNHMFRFCYQECKELLLPFPAYFYLTMSRFKGTWNSSYRFKNSINCPYNLILSTPLGAWKSWNDLSELTHQFLLHSQILLHMPASYAFGHEIIFLWTHVTDVTDVNFSFPTAKRCHI